MLAFLLLIGIVRADMVTPGMHRVAYELQVDGLAEHPDHVLIVWPHSLSNGMPEAHLAQVPVAGQLAIGRRVDGKPELYALRRSDWQAWSDREPNDRVLATATEADLLALAVPCGVDLGSTAQEVVGCSRAQTLQHRFHARRLADDACEIDVIGVEKLGSSGQPLACGCASAGGHGSGLGLGALLLWLARRREARTTR